MWSMCPDFYVIEGASSMWHQNTCAAILAWCKHVVTAPNDDEGQKEVWLSGQNDASMLQTFKLAKNTTNAATNSI